MLKESEETLFTHPLPPARAERLKVIKDGCDAVLADLQTLVNKYESLGTKSKQTWVRMKWGNEDIAEIRARLTSNITMLTAFISTSQISVETKLDKFIEEFRQGKREASVASLQTADSLSADDRALWRTIRKELEEIGISVAAFDANRGFIFDWFVRAVETGAFEEQNEHGIDEESSDSDEGESWINLEQDHRDTGRQIERAESESLGSISEDQTLASAPSSGSALNAEPNVLERNPETSDQIFASARTPPRDRTNTPRVATLLARMSRPRRRLIMNTSLSTNHFSTLMKTVTLSSQTPTTSPTTLRLENVKAGSRCHDRATMPLNLTGGRGASTRVKANIALKLPVTKC